MTNLEISIYNTVRYFSLFDMPVTAVHIWRSLVLDHPPAGGDSPAWPAGRRLRWQGQALPRLREVREQLAHSTWLKARVEQRWGYVYLQGNSGSLPRRLARHVLAQHKWRLTRRLAWWIALVPGVRMVAGSGSLALSNTRPSSDLDIFVIAAQGRIWTARLLLLFVAQLLGRRRKHWDEQAPDQLCFNHFISDSELVMPPAVRNLYTAVAYTHLTPLFGLTWFERFQQENAAWIRHYVMYPDPVYLSPQQAVSPPYPLRLVKKFLTGLLLEPLGNFGERLAERIQRRAIVRHTQPGRGGRVAISNQELAFHPDSRVPEILREFTQDAGQRALL